MQSQENPFDKACRYLAKMEPPAVIAFLLELANEDFDFIRWLDTRRLAFPGQPDRICDTVAHVENIEANRVPWAVVVEFMIEPDSLMFGRLLSYLGLVWIEEKPSNERGDRFELGGVIVNLRGKGASSRNHVWSKAGLTTHLGIREVNLSTLSAADILEQIAQGKQSRVILPWIPLMQGGNESAIIARWKELAAAEPNSQRRSDFGALVLVFADAADCWDTWKIALKEWNMTESRQVNEWQNQARRELRVETLVKLLQHKFGSLPADVSLHLQAIDDAKIVDQLLFDVIDASNLDEFRRQIPNGVK